MKKILIIQDVYEHYRRELFEGIAENCELYIACVDSCVGYSNNRIYRMSKRNILGIEWFGGLIKAINDIKPDTVLLGLNFRHLASFVAYFRFKSIKFVWWGAMLSNKVLIRFIQRILLRNFNNFIFYNQYQFSSVKQYLSPKAQVFIIKNSIPRPSINYKANNKEKKYILCIGSLTHRKGYENVIKAFAKSRIASINNLKLIFVGGGEAEPILKLTAENIGSENIKFFGSIIDKDILNDIFNKTLFATSFSQAGLSIAHCAIHKVPYLTNMNATSSGEHFEILSGINGFLAILVDDYQKYFDYMSDSKNLSHVLDMGENAYAHYLESSDPLKMRYHFLRALN